MYEIAEQVLGWLDDGARVQVALVAETQGFSSRDPGAALAWTEDGRTAGALFASLDEQLPATGDTLSGRLATFTVSDADAATAGLSCGGRAVVLVLDASALPDGTWLRLHRREPVCVVVVVEGESVGSVEVFSRADVRDATRIEGAHDVPRLFARGTSATAVTREEGRAVVAVSLWPPTTLLVVGNGLIADALVAAAGLLGWSAVVTDGAERAAVAVSSLHESDAAVVLSHDRAVDVPVLEALLAGRAGYVGALGSRHTQAARREGLVGRGVDTAAMDRIHGPAGLDLDAHTPGEIAVSIVAEILAVRAGASGASISHREGPVHTSGVHAPPPRH